MKQLFLSFKQWKQVVPVSMFFCLIAYRATTAPATGEEYPQPTNAAALLPLRLPGNVPPVMACWFMRTTDFTACAYEPYLREMARHSRVNVLTTSIRAPGKLVTDEAVREQIRQANQFASQFGIRLAMDLDVRLAREAFREAFPDELQEMLRLREVALKDSGEVALSIAAENPSDHYTFLATPYIPLGGKVVRVYAYERTAQGIKPDTVQDITSQCRTTLATTNQVSVSIPCDEGTKGRTACMMVAFEHLSPDVFAPHLLSFQRQILERYRDIPLAGACKDEWGFPPYQRTAAVHKDHWYSRFMGRAYAQATGGRDLVRDFLLMTFGETGREAERVAAINQFNDLCRRRHGDIETDFYHAVKSVWGRDAFVATHPTWLGRAPGRLEFQKNGLSWWVARRDFAQTDEVTPYSVRTSLAKKWNSPVWFNMFYLPEAAGYRAELWGDALAGGRINYHPPFHSSWLSDPTRDPVPYRALLRDGLMRGDCRVRLLNFITRSPLDCPVAVVFGQACAMNWAGPAYEDVGLALSDALWQAGYPADLIPANEVETGSLRVGADGYVHYGPQRYESVVLYHPQFEKAVTGELFRKAAKGQSQLYRVGEWTQDFEGREFAGSAALPGKMVVLADAKTGAGRVVNDLKSAGVVSQTPASRFAKFAYKDTRTVAPPTEGESRLLDGTHLFVSALNSASGDPIRRTLQVDHHAVDVDAVGLVAIRLDQHGRMQALAAGGLKALRSDHLEIELPERIDVALWREEQGRFRGVLQGWNGPVPASLQALCKDWLRLSLPTPIGDLDP